MAKYISFREMTKKSLLYILYYWHFLICINLSLISNVGYIFPVFHCVQAAHSNMMDTELHHPPSQRAGWGELTQVIKNQSSYCIYSLFWRHWILVALIKPEGDIPRMKGCTSITCVSNSVLWVSPDLEGFLDPCMTLLWCGARGACSAGKGCNLSSSCGTS